MLLRIAPTMFEEDVYGCQTIHNVWEEFIQNARIGRDYPWRAELKKHVKSIPQGQLETDSFCLLFKLVNRLATQPNTRTGSKFNLSHTDRRVATTCLDRHLELCTAEHELEDFMAQQFNRNNVSPLQLVNNWLERKLIDWDDERQSVIGEWCLRERPQPVCQIQRFRELTGRVYPSSQRSIKPKS